MPYDSTGDPLERGPSARACISTALNDGVCQEWLEGRLGYEPGLRFEAFRGGLMVVHEHISNVTAMCSGGTPSSVFILTWSSDVVNCLHQKQSKSRQGCR